MVMRKVLVLALLVLGATLTGCSGLYSVPGEGGGRGGTGSLPDFAVSLTPASVTAPQGGFGETALTVRPRNNFTGAISLSLAAGLDEVPKGLTLSLDRVSVSGTSPVSWTLRLYARPTTPTGTYRLKLRATSGDLTREADLTVEVTPPSPDFTISLNPTSLTVQQGSSGTTQLTIASLNGFAGTVSLALAGAPSGVTLSPSSVDVPEGGSVTRSLTLAVDPTVDPGTYGFQVKATGGGLTKTANLSLRVTAAPDFTVSLDPESLTVQQGSSGTTTLTITPQNGFSGAVNLSLVDENGNPVPGITLSPTGVSVAGSSPVTQDLTVSVAGSVVAGTYSLQLKATSGSLVKTAPLDLTVTTDTGGGGGSGTAVTVKQQGSGSSLVYYRVGSGNWQPLTLSGGQGTFTATGDYEVAARCDDDSTLHLFKVSTSYQNQVTFFCGPGPITRDVDFTVTLPSSVGGVDPQSGDGVFVGPYSGTYNGTDPVTVSARGLKAEAGSAVVTLHRPSFSLSGISTAPYGYKVVNLGASDTSVAVDGSGWQAFTSTKSLSASKPVGFDQAGAFVFHFSDAYLIPALVGFAGPSSGSPVSGQYGLLPSGGVHVGLYSATKTGATTDTLLVIQDTGGSDWNPTPPVPWTSGQFSVSGGTLTFARTDARAFFAEFSGLAQRTGGAPLKLKVFVQAASGGSTAYQIPTVPGLDYALVSNPSAVDFSLSAFIQDRGAEYADAPDLFFLTGAQVSGVDVVLAQKRGTYSGSNYTLP
jgi:hypothetical protein